MLDALVAASFYGIAGAIPVPAASSSALLTQATGILGQLTGRRSTALQTTLPATDPTTILGVITAVLGNGAFVLPHFTPVGLASVQSAFAQSAAMAAVDPTALDRWIFQLSHIRPAVERFDLALAATSLLGIPIRPRSLWASFRPHPATAGSGCRSTPTVPPHPAGSRSRHSPSATRSLSLLTPA